MRKFLFVLLLVLLSTGVTAELSFEVTLTPSEQSIRMNETAEYVLAIRHDAVGTVLFDLFSTDVLLDVRAADELVVPSGGLTTKLTVRPTRPRELGYYVVPIIVRATQQGISKRVHVLLGLRPEIDLQREYTPSIRTKITVPKQVDPRQSLIITADIENLNPRNIREMTAHLRSSTFSQDNKVTVAPLEKKQLTFTVALDPLNVPQDDVLYVSFVTEHENRTIRFDSQPVPFSIMEYGDIDETFEKTSSFLKSIEKIHLSNSGNREKTTTYRLQGSIFSVVFTRTDPPRERMSGFYVWEVTLAPKESRTIVVYKNYWPLFIVLVLTALGVAGYYVFRPPVTLTKKARFDHGSKTIRVSLYVKNRSQSRIDSIELLDRVPRMFEIGKEFGPGSVTPANVLVSEQLGSKLKWQLTHVRSGEEMVVSYAVKSKLTMVGTITLDPATASVVVGHKKYHVKSRLSTVPVTH